MVQGGLAVPAALVDPGGLEDLVGEARLRGRLLLVVLEGPEGLVDQVGLSVLVDLLVFLLELENGETRVVRRLRHPHRGRPGAEAAAGRDEEVPSRLDWNYDLACWDDRSYHLYLARAKRRVTGWFGFEGWLAI